MHDRLAFDRFTAISIADELQVSIPEQANLLKTQGISFFELGARRMAFGHNGA